MSAKWKLFDDTPRPDGRVFRETKIGNARVPQSVRAFISRQ